MRAYDPTLGRFLSRDPLGRAPLFGVNDNPYVYAGNNPLSNVDPSGQYRAAGHGSALIESWDATKQHMADNARIATVAGTPTTPGVGTCGGCKFVAVASATQVRNEPVTGSQCDRVCVVAGKVKKDADSAFSAFKGGLTDLGIITTIGSGVSLTLLKDTILSKVATGVLIGVDADIAMGAASFWWESSQSTEWFELQSNVDAFFTIALILIAAVAFSAGLSGVEATVETVGMSDFVASGMLVGMYGILTAFDRAQREQDHEYASL